MLPYHPGTLPHPAALAGDPIAWAALRRILVVRPDNLGDVIMLGPALRALRGAAPAAEITLLASPAGAAVAPLLPEIDSVIIHSPVWQDAGRPSPPDPGAQHELVATLAAGGFDAAVIITSFSQSPYPAAYACYLAEVPVRAAVSREFGGALLTHWVPAPEITQHQVDRALHLLAQLGVPATGQPTLHVDLPPDATATARRLTGLDPAAPYLVILPGASCSSRRWFSDRFGAVARMLAERGWSVVVAGSKREAGLVEQVRTAAGSPESVLGVAGGLRVSELAGLIAGAAVAITNNSGGMHLADALRTPLVALFAGTELVPEYEPRSTVSRILRRPTDCTPCRSFRCPYAHECLDVSAEEVVAAASSISHIDGQHAQ